MNWAFRTAEDVVKSAVTFSAPIVNAFDRPINFVDQTIVKGIDKLEASAPIIKEQPAEILNQAKTKVMDVVQPRIERVHEMRKAGEQKAASLKELSYNKANEVLATHYGSLAVSGVDSTAALAERLLDSFFPKNQDEETEEDDSEFLVPLNLKNLNLFSFYNFQSQYLLQKTQHSIPFKLLVLSQIKLLVASIEVYPDNSRPSKRKMFSNMLHHSLPFFVSLNT